MFLMRSELFVYTLYMQLTPKVLQKFRTVTAKAVNRFCSQRVCIVDEQKLVNSLFRAYKVDIT